MQGNVTLIWAERPCDFRSIDEPSCETDILKPQQVKPRMAECLVERVV